MKIGFTGTQSGMTNFQKIALLETLQHFKCSEFCHGDCIGADKEANNIALEFGIKVFTIFPPLEGKKRAWVFNREHQKMGYEWNPIIFSSGNLINVRWMPSDTYLESRKHLIDNVEHFIAAPKEYEHSIKSAVWSVIRYAWKVKRGVTIIPPVIRED